LANARPFLRPIDRAFGMTADPSARLLVACPNCATTNRVAPDRLADGATCGSCKAPLFPGRPLALTAATFARHVNADIPLVVDFWAEWCGPCRMMAPAFEQAAERVAPGVRLAKVDTEAESALAAQFGIRSIPTLIAFRNGREIARQAGALPLPQLLQWITTHAQN
jgi:thioredoxin 2